MRVSGWCGVHAITEFPRIEYGLSFVSGSYAMTNPVSRPSSMIESRLLVSTEIMSAST